ncbi:MAG TPA: M20 family metallopeptidase [Nitrolancea sp.]
MITVEDVRARRGEMLDTLKTIVELESPSADKAAVDRLVTHLRERIGAAGGDVEALPQSDYGDLTISRWAGTEGQKPLLVMTHIDTVWPIGTLTRKPFSVDDAEARGPGIYDMKASVAMMLQALTFLRENSVGHRPLTWLINTEEEVGSPVSRPVIEKLASESEYVLVLEPPVAPNGALKTARKGVGMFTMHITGLAAHAGADPEKGVSAIQELANQIQYLHGLTDFTLGTTVNVGVVSGGTARNVVAAEAIALIDLRVTTMAEGDRVVKSILSAEPRLPRSKIRVEGGLNRPPMERTNKIAAAFQQVRTAGQRLGLQLSEASTGGGSDGNFTAAIGATTIDGLGCTGDGAHAEHEHISLDGFVERTALLTELISTL